MIREAIGPDEVRFESVGRGAADRVRALLPRLRASANEIMGHPGPASLRIVLTDAAPRARDVLRLSAFYWKLLLAVAAIAFGIAVAYGMAALVFLAPFFSVLVIRLILYVRRLRAAWPRASGFTVSWHPVLDPVVVVHWPHLVGDPELAGFVLRSDDDRYLAGILAHEYCHVVLHLIRKDHPPPPWLDEGLAFWFSEQASGVPLLRPETRQYLAEPEPNYDPRSRFGRPGQMPAYMRLMSRYYWEVRALAEAGQLVEAIHARPRRLAELRPHPPTKEPG